MNRWMANYDYVCFMAHSGWALALSLAASIALGHDAAIPAAIAIGAAAFAKEFWYDLRFELPQQTIVDGLKDFAGYAAGAAAGFGACEALHALGRIS